MVLVRFGRANDLEDPTRNNYRAGKRETSLCRLRNRVGQRYRTKQQRHQQWGASARQLYPDTLQTCSNVRDDYCHGTYLIFSFDALFKYRSALFSSVRRRLMMCSPSWLDSNAPTSADGRYTPTLRLRPVTLADLMKLIALPLLKRNTVTRPKEC